MLTLSILIFPKMSSFNSHCTHSLIINIIEYMLEKGSFPTLYYGKALSLLREVCPIPSPSLNEDKRVEFILKYLKKEGIDTAFSDDAKNVVIPYNDDGSVELDVFAAHTDVVFPDTLPLPFKEEGDYIYSPGCGDDTASFVALLMYAIHFFKTKPKTERGILFVCNSAEEGMGNLKGIRKLFSTYGDRIRSFTTFDECFGKGIVNTAVGSERYLIKVKTEGGHSFKDYGKRNAIALLSEIVTKLYMQDVSALGRTTYNVGTISGGTSVNTIAEEAECTYEFRSTERKALETMHSNFEAVISSFSHLKDAYVSYECIGVRPCAGSVDISWMEEAAESVMREYGLKTERLSSSTDANIPLSLGIPALCIGIVEMQGQHTRKEKMRLSSYKTGLDLGYDYILKITGLS